MLKSATICLGTIRSGMMLNIAMLNCSLSTKIQSIALANPISLEKDVIYFSAISPEQYNSHGLAILDWLTQLKRNYELKFVWLVRNPLASCAAYEDVLKIVPSKGMKYWHDINVMLSYLYLELEENQRLIQKYENTLLFGPEKIFCFFDIPFDTQYLHYGDFDQPYSDPIFSKGYIDTEQIDPRPKSNALLDVWTAYHKTDVMHFLEYDQQRKD